MIDLFRGEHAFLSNFYKCSAEFEGMTYPILTKKDGEQELRLTCNDVKYDRKTAWTVLSLFCEKLTAIMNAG